jgi:hypothetical protein
MNLLADKANARYFAVAMTVTIAFLAATAYAGGPAPEVPLEYQVKAAFLHKFIKFIEWPDRQLTDTSTVIIGSIGESPMVAALQALSDKELEDPRVCVRRFESSDDLEFCHILFVPASEDENLAEILAELGRAGTLTVGESQRFAGFRGMINFVIADKKIGFEVDIGSVHRHGLRISSKLLRLAKEVRGLD